MTVLPVPADDAVRRSPFAGSDVTAAAGLRLAPGGQAVLFEHDVWDFTGIAGQPVHMAATKLRLGFTTIINPAWVLVAKEYLFARLAPAHPSVAVLAAAYRVPLTLASCGHRLRETIGWLNWLTSQQISGLGEVTQDHCDRYLTHRNRRTDAAGDVIGTLGGGATRLPAAVLTELADYRELFTTDAYRPGFTPWAGRSASGVAGIRVTGENKTPPLDTLIVQPLLAAAFYLTDTLGRHVIPLAQSVRAHRDERSLLARESAGAEAVTGVLAAYIATGRPLDAAGGSIIARRVAGAWDDNDPLLHVSFSALARAAGCERLTAKVIAALRPAVADALEKVGIAQPWARDAVPVPRADDTGPVPWTLPLEALQVRYLITMLHTACLIITATVTGMRSCELMELRIGCRRATTLGPGLVRYRLAGKLIKGQGLSGIDDEWVVIEEVDRAVALAGQLSSQLGGSGVGTGSPVFGRFNFPDRYLSLQAWVNGQPGQRLGLAPIPDGTVNLRMMRRSLARELAYRPGGLLAAKVHLRHISAATTEGYSSRPGGAQAKLLAEIGEHEADRKLAVVLEEYRKFESGIMPAGPGARELIGFFSSVEAQMAARASAPNLAASGQHLLNLLAKRAGILHFCTANLCWFQDPSRALCLLLAGTPDARQPLAGMCDSARCPQATHHACHRDVWASAQKANATFIGAIGRSQSVERARLQAENDRCQRVLDAIDAANPAPPGAVQPDAGAGAGNGDQ
ncbi:MAG: hypothetical protein ACRDOH_09245 [Streptosporangiaceae bacterium]